MKESILKLHEYNASCHVFECTIQRAVCSVINFGKAIKAIILFPKLEF